MSVHPFEFQITTVFPCVPWQLHNKFPLVYNYQLGITVLDCGINHPVNPQLVSFYSHLVIWCDWCLRYLLLNSPIQGVARGQPSWLLPPWALCVIYPLVAVLLGACLAVVGLYGSFLPRTVVLMWLASTLSAFLTSALLLEPLKVGSNTSFN